VCVSYRRSAIDWPPSESRVVYFNGEPKPADIKSGWVCDVWKLNGFTSLPEMRGVNVEHDALWANIAANAKRDLPWFTGFRERGEPVAIVCGGPSMKDSLADIRAQRRRGAKIVTVNNAMRFLMEHGITPDVHVMLDARPANAAFVQNAPQGVKYLIASQCHPSVFDALEGRDVVLWHSAFGDNAQFREVLDPWWSGPNQKPVVLVPGGGTVGLRCTVALRAVRLQENPRLWHGFLLSSRRASRLPAAPQRRRRFADVEDGGQHLLLRPLDGQASHRIPRNLGRPEPPGGQHLRAWSGLIPDMARALRSEAMVA
jgi:hypothetical protein